jgi:hypothetical protein
MPSGSRDVAGARLPGSVRTLRRVLIALLVASAALTIVGLPELQDAVAAGRWPRAALAIPLTFLGLFIVGYAVYRYALVRAGRYPAGKALVRVALMAVILGVIAGIVLDWRRTPGGDHPVDLGRGLRSSDPDVRAMAAELVRHRPPDVARAHVDGVIRLLGDASPEVRQQARATLVALAGTDVGGSGADAAARWQAWWRERAPVR